MIKLLWADLETTGLSVPNDLVLEICLRITDEDIRNVDKFEAVIHYPSDAYSIANMDESVREMHEGNGLLAEVESSTLELQEVRDSAYEWLCSHMEEDEKIVIAGSNPAFDKGFLEMHFNRLVEFLHYRTFDMNTLYYFLGQKKKKSSRDPKSFHRAGPDLERDITMLRCFRLAVRDMPDGAKSD
jgi:oligoribonuclease (3'-5' exoribonuclease)